MVIDNHGASDNSNYNSLVVYDTNAGSLIGLGSYNSQAGAYVLNPSATGELKFSIQTKYKNRDNVPTGKLLLDFKTANFIFKLTSYQWLVVSGNKAQLKGLGTVNGSGNYSIFIDVIDESKRGGIDKIRIRILNYQNNAIYDNQLGNPETTNPITPVTKGYLKIY